MIPDRQTVCLCMIVKNEAHVIRRCLASVRPIIDHWIVVDTGSTDGTQGIVREALADLPGEVVERPWVDFAHNRTEALALARPHGTYSLVIDADDTLEVPPGYAVPALDADSYALDIVYGPTTYRRPQLVRNALPWRYRGVLHEFLECEGATTAGHLPVVMRINKEGARSADPDLYRRDAAILERALESERDPFLVSRYTFYLAQSYRDSGQREPALAAYLRRADLGFWDEEVFYSLYQAGRLMEALGRPPDEVVATYRRATAACPSRAEAVHAASRLYRGLFRYAEGCTVAEPALSLPVPAGGLFVEPWIYEYGLLDEFAVNAYWAGRFRDCLDASLRALSGGKVPPHEVPRHLANMRFALDKLPATGAQATADVTGSDGRTSDVIQPPATAPRSTERQVTVFRKQVRINRKIHVVWVGDEGKRPDNCIDTWRQLNPDWEVVVWGNRELDATDWRNRKHIEIMRTREWNGVADMMRWEILDSQGGFAIDADAICVRPLEDWLFEPDVFACWENEIARPGLIAAGYVYARPGNALVRRVISDIEGLSDLTSKRAWQTVGPQRLTDTVRAMAYTGLTIYPSHFFIPDHLSGTKYSGGAQVFAEQLWGSTGVATYDNLFKQNVEVLRRK